MDEQNNNKRVLNIELDNDVKKVSITGTNGDEKVVMRQELSEDDLDQASGGGNHVNYLYAGCDPNCEPLKCSAVH
jgi:dsDNA-specific endonuclease/ATPase MutS2